MKYIIAFCFIFSVKAQAAHWFTFMFIMKPNTFKVHGVKAF